MDAHERRPGATIDINAASDAESFGKPARGWRRRLFEIIFEADTPRGKHSTP